MKRFLLIDCNNFFVSCERLFNPVLIGKPVIVLSSNDGCIIARSNEAKALGISMGGPAFEWQEVIKKHNVIVYSSNFSLYSDISLRIMQILAEQAADLEVYSVDEAFLHLVDVGVTSPSYYADTARMILYTIKKYTGIPVTIGIGPTKTLAKVATKIAKKQLQYGGVLDVSDWCANDLDQVLAQVPVGDIWGIGRRSAAFLQAHRIITAKDFKYANDRWIQKNLTVTGLRTLHELRGIPCFQVETMPQPKQSITVSRSFGKPVLSKEHLYQAVAMHASSAMRQLRQGQMRVTGITVFAISTRYHDAKRRYDAHYIELDYASSYTPDVIAAAKECVDKLFILGTMYKKIGIMLTNLIPADSVQLLWNAQTPPLHKYDDMMQALDRVNRRWGSHQAIYAAQGINHPWRVKQGLKSPCFTTSWHELLRVKA